jgi:hypothetical protein
MRETSYAREIASADIGGCRIERIHVKEADQEEIRFSWWKDGKFQARPLDLPEDDLLMLFGEAVVKGVFSEEFLTGLQTMLNGHFGDSETA